MTYISIATAAESVHCVANEDGGKVFDLITAAFERGEESVTLDFAGVKDLTPSFLNSAIGQMYGVFTEETIRRIRAVNLSDIDKYLVSGVIKNAKRYFRIVDKVKAAESVWEQRS